MGRPPLPPGTAGSVRHDVRGGKHRARCLFADLDGVTREVLATGKSKSEADRRLKVAIRDRKTPSASAVTASTPLADVVETWWEEAQTSGRLSPASSTSYRSCLDKVILVARDDREGITQLPLRELTTSRLDRFIKLVEQERSSKMTRTLLRQVLDLAVRHDAIGRNPMDGVAKAPAAQPRGTRRNDALPVEDLAAFREAIWQWSTGEDRPGPRRAVDLADIVDLLLSTGARTGEVLAARWSDIAFDAEPVALTICGTLVSTKADGLYRQSWTKTSAGYRLVHLPGFAVEMLLRRRVEAAPNPLGAVFPSRAGTWRWPHNVRRQWRDARAATGFGWVTPKTFRKTVASILANELGTEAAAQQLGHANTQVTEGHYISRPAEAPDVTEWLNQLAPHRQRAE